MKKSGQIEYDEGIERIIEIGKSEICNINDLHYFLPDFPNLMGWEVVFFNFKLSEFFLDNIEYIIKGLHYIELEYRKRIGNEFGFGSPSKTCDLINKISKRYPGKAKELEEWISNNGGNYHIEKKEK